MAQLQSGKYTVAWFKLAEFVVRKEKERALGIYRLLSHSLPNQALSAQLQGDLLLSFYDDKAIDAYLKAALLYEKNKNIVQAAALFEHLVSLQPNNLEFIIKMFNLYSLNNNHNKMVKSINCASKILNWTTIQDIINFANDLRLNLEYKSILFESIIINLVSQKEFDKKNYDLLDHLALIIGSLPERLTNFMAKLKTLDDEPYQYMLQKLDESAGKNSFSNS